MREKSLRPGSTGAWREAPEEGREPIPAQREPLQSMNQDSVAPRPDAGLQPRGEGSSEAAGDYFVTLNVVVPNSFFTSDALASTKQFVATSQPP